MDRSRTPSASDADAPLRADPPAAGQLRDKKPEGETPNDSYPVEGKAAWRARPGQYPAAKEGIADPDRPGVKKR